MNPEESAALVAALTTKLSQRPLLLAIDGPSAAGTTTLAGVLGLQLGASVVNGDDFYRDMPEDQRWNLSAAEGINLYFNWQRMRREALEPLKLRKSAAYRPYSWRPEGGLAIEPVVLDATEVVVVEGVYAARPEFRDLIDAAVFVDTPAEERQQRIAARGHAYERWWSRWDAAEDHYYTKIRPKDSFDLVVPGV